MKIAITKLVIFVLISILVSGINSKVHLHETKALKILQNIKAKKLDRDPKFIADSEKAFRIYLKYSKMKSRDKKFHDDLNSELIQTNMALEAGALGFYKFLYYNQELENEKAKAKKNKENNKNNEESSPTLLADEEKRAEEVVNKRLLQSINITNLDFYIDYTYFVIMDFDVCRPECQHGCESCAFVTDGCLDYGLGLCPFMMCANNYCGTWNLCNCSMGIGCHVDHVCDEDYIIHSPDMNPLIWAPCINPTGEYGYGDVGNICMEKPHLFIDFVPVCDHNEDPNDMGIYSWD